MRAGRYWMRVSRFFTMAASWRGVLLEPRLPRLFFMFAQAPSTVMTGVWPRLGNDIGRDPPAVFDLHAVGLGPVAHLAGAGPFRRGPALVPGWPAGRAGYLPVGPGIRREHAAQFLGVGRAQVDLEVLPSRQKWTVLSASPPSRSSTNSVCIFCAIPISVRAGHAILQRIMCH